MAFSGLAGAAFQRFFAPLTPIALPRTLCKSLKTRLNQRNTARFQLRAMPARATIFGFSLAAPVPTPGWL
jgi:hypothetical protein